MKVKYTQVSAFESNTLIQWVACICDSHNTIMQWSNADCLEGQQEVDAAPMS